MSADRWSPETVEELVRAMWDATQDPYIRTHLGFNAERRRASAVMDRLDALGILRDDDEGVEYVDPHVNCALTIDGLRAALAGMTRDRDNWRADATSKDPALPCIECGEFSRFLRDGRCFDCRPSMAGATP